MKKKFIIWGIVIVLVGGGIAFRASKRDNENYVQVKTAQVAQGDIKSYLSTTATIKSKTSKDYFPLQGKVKAVNVKVGDTVVKGQSLVEYEIVDPSSAVKQAQIQYDNAVLSKQILLNNNNDIKNKIAEMDKQIQNIDKQIAELQKSIGTNATAAYAGDQVSQLEKTRELLEAAYDSMENNPAEALDLKVAIDNLTKKINELASGALGVFTGDVANTDSASLITTLQTQKAQLKQTRDSLKPISNEQLKQADNSIALAKLALDNAKLSLSKSQDKIIADFDGVVTSVSAVEGATSMASPQATVTVQDIANLKAILLVGKFDAEKIKVGQDAVIKSSSKEYKGKVSTVDPAAKKSISAAGSETTLGVEIDILDKAEDLKIDFDTDVDVLLGEVSNVIKVPAESIKTNKEGKAFVYIIKEGKAVEKEVKLGMQSDMEAQVLEGLNASDKVILNPGETVKNGTLVKEAGEK